MLLSRPNTVLEDIRQHIGRDRRIHEQSFLGLPLYGRHRGEAERGFPDVVVDRIQALMYNQFFYFPPSSTEPTPSCMKPSDAWTGFRRFTLTRWLREPCPLRLHQDCWDMLREWVAGYITGEVSPDLLDLRSGADP